MTVVEIAVVEVVVVEVAIALAVAVAVAVTLAEAVKVNVVVLEVSVVAVEEACIYALLVGCSAMSYCSMIMYTATCIARHSIFIRLVLALACCKLTHNCSILYSDRSRFYH